MVSHTPYSGSFGGMCTDDAGFSSFAQQSASRFSLAFSDTANSFIGDLRQFPPYLFVLSQNMTATYRLLWP